MLAYSTQHPTRLSKFFDCKKLCCRYFISILRMTRTILIAEPTLHSVQKSLIAFLRLQNNFKNKKIVVTKYIHSNSKHFWLNLFPSRNCSLIKAYWFDVKVKMFTIISESCNTSHQVTTAQSQTQERIWGGR